MLCFILLLKQIMEYILLNSNLTEYIVRVSTAITNLIIIAMQYICRLIILRLIIQSHLTRNNTNAWMLSNLFKRVHILTFFLLLQIQYCSVFY